MNRLFSFIRNDGRNSFKYFVWIQLVVFFFIFVKFYCHQESQSLTFRSTLHPQTKNENALDQIRIRLIAWDEKSKTSYDIPKALNGLDVVIPEGKSFNFNGSTGTLKLECVSKIPVTWSYFGLGRPEFKSLTHLRKTDLNFRDESKYIYESVLDFGNTSLRELDTGKYSCHGIEDANLSTSDNGSNQGPSSYLFIFVPGSEIMFGRGRHGHDPTEILHDGPIATIPCVVSDPDVFLNLYYENETEPIELSKAISFDPKSGFLITISEGRNPWGLYICKLQKSTTVAVKSISFRLIKAFTDIPVQVEPRRSSIIAKGSHPIFFKCEAAEELEIVFAANFAKPIVAYESLEDKTSPLNNYRASFIASPWHLAIDNARSRIKSSKFQCRRKKDGMILHTWEYRVKKPGEILTELRLTFNPFIRQFTCCPGPLEFPVLKLVPCSSRPECNLKSISHKELSNSHLIFNMNRGCAKWVPTKSSSFGLLQCSSKTDSEEILMYSDNYTIHIKSNLNASEDDKSFKDLFLQKLSSPSPEYVILKCKASAFTFSGGLKWTLLKGGSGKDDAGTYEDVIHPKKERFEPPFYSNMINVTRSKDKTTLVTCHAPLLTSGKWMRIKFNVKPMDFKSMQKKSN